jgi:hypothetical protein
MNRRKFLNVSTASIVGLGLTSGLVWHLIPSASEQLNISKTLEKLARIEKSIPDMTGQWNLATTLMHCAQSVDYSIDGYPEHKSDLFKATAGAFAFSAFKAKGQMTHNLSEAIPGAPIIPENQNLEAAIEAFRLSLIRFQSHKGPLLPHFAYGNLSKADYEKAHAMHLNNHMLEMVI